MQCSVLDIPTEECSFQEWRMCPTCERKHYYTAFCNCGRCYYVPKDVEHTEIGTLITCYCGIVNVGD